MPLDNIITLTDSYKVSHYRQYPPGTQRVRSYFESRVGARYPVTKFFGLQYILKRYFVGDEVITIKKIEHAKKLFDAHMGPGIFNEQGWRDMLKKYHGKLPLHICAVPEGLEVPINNVLFTVENTDNDFPWLTNYVETILTHTWAPSGVCTRSKMMKNTILKALELSGDPKIIDFKLHDFGFRGVSSVETAALSGAAHLVNFMGTDTCAAIELLMDYYGADEMPGFSIPAYEHSTVTAWGKLREVDCYRNALKQYPDGMVAVVSDSYDIYNACRNIWGDTLKDEVLARDGVLVIRPDSGEPHTVVPNVLQILDETFGSTVNEKGYIVLNPHVRVIQGDGIDEYTLPTILNAVMDAGFSADNPSFGSGGGLLQKIDRDTQRNAFKCNEVTIDGVDYPVFKTPKTDMTKASKGGKLKLIKDDNGYRTVNYKEPGEDILVSVFDNGNLLVDHKLKNIRAQN